MLIHVTADDSSERFLTILSIKSNPEIDQNRGERKKVDLNGSLSVQHVLEPQLFCSLCLHGCCLSLSGYSLSPVLLRLQRLQRDMHLACSSSQPRWSGESSQHHSVPLQEVPAEEAEEREVDEGRDYRGETHSNTQNTNNKALILLIKLLG